MEGSVSLVEERSSQNSSELVVASNVKVGWELEIRNLQFERPPIYVITSPPFQPTMKLTEIISKNE